MFQVGSRVERNPVEWEKWFGGDSFKDGGVGNLGTVIEVKKTKVRVHWDINGNDKEWYKTKKKTLKIVAMERRDNSKFDSINRKNLDILEKGLHFDFTVVYYNEERKEIRMPCHKSFLASGSEYFSQLFESEKGVSEMEIKEFNYIIVENFVKFFYTTCVDEKVLKDNAGTFMEIATKFSVRELKDIAEKLMQSSLARANILEMMMAGYKYEAPKLKYSAMEFLTRNKDMFAENEKDWRDAMSGKEDLLFDLVKMFCCGAGSGREEVLIMKH